MALRNRTDVIEQRLSEIERQLDKVYTALVIRDPGTRMSSEAYDGLRKQVIAASGDRMAHLSQLAELDVALARGASTEDLKALTNQWIQQAGIARIDDPTETACFEDTGNPSSEDRVVVLPAYVDNVTSRLIRQGRLASTGGSSSESDGPASLDPAPVDGAVAQVEDDQ
jgi:hypothetical protein